MSLVLLKQHKFLKSYDFNHLGIPSGNHPLYKILNKIVRTFELILINDGSRDETSKKILELKKNFKKIRFYNFDENKGKSYILKKTFKVTKYENIIFIDSDLPYFKNLENIKLFAHEIYKSR